MDPARKAEDQMHAGRDRAGSAPGPAGEPRSWEPHWPSDCWIVRSPLRQRGIGWRGRHAH